MGLTLISCLTQDTIILFKPTLILLFLFFSLIFYHIIIVFFSLLIIIIIKLKKNHVVCICYKTYLKSLSNIISFVDRVTSVTGAGHSFS